MLSLELTKKYGFKFLRAILVATACVSFVITVFFLYDINQKNIVKIKIEEHIADKYGREARVFYIQRYPSSPDISAVVKMNGDGLLFTIDGYTRPEGIIIHDNYEQYFDRAEETVKNGKISSRQEDALE